MENISSLQAGWMTKVEIAQHFQIGVRTVTDWMRRGILPFVKVGHVVRFNKLDCEMALQKFGVNRSR